MNLPPETRILRLDAAGVVDADQSHVPGSLLVELDHLARQGGFWRAGLKILAAGSPASVSTHPAAEHAVPRSFPQGVLMPGLVNAHTHLDLTTVGHRPRNPTEGFLGFIETVRTHRPVEDSAIAGSVLQGVDLCLKSAVVAVGDIAGAPRGRVTATSYRTLAQTPLRGVSFLEFFALGMREEETWSRVEQAARALPGAAGGFRLGLQPHAPYSVSPQAYRRAIALADALSLPLATHLAESPEEREFIALARGPIRILLERVGMWDESLELVFAKGRTPVRHLCCAIPPPTTPLVFAHVHDLSDEEIELIAELGASVVYCPTAGEYFGAAEHFGPHPYQRLRRAGINVALGTDSIINQPHGDLSVWREMRLLYKRDGTPPAWLLRMATVNGARALGLCESLFRFQPGNRVAGIAFIPSVGRDPLSGALMEDQDLNLLILGS